MKKSELLKEVIATYGKHGWQLRQVLLQPATQTEVMADAEASLRRLSVREAEVDALWFSRPSHNNREAWELRLLADTQYALFETFEADETEEQREDVRLEMEARLRDYSKLPK